MHIVWCSSSYIEKSCPGVGCTAVSDAGTYWCNVYHIVDCFCIYDLWLLDMGMTVCMVKSLSSYVQNDTNKVCYESLLWFMVGVQSSVGVSALFVAPLSHFFNVPSVALTYA